MIAELQPRVIVLHLTDALFAHLQPFLAGLDITHDRIRTILAKLGFVFDGWRVSPPTWRRDAEGRFRGGARLLFRGGLVHVR